MRKPMYEKRTAPERAARIRMEVMVQKTMRPCLFGMSCGANDECGIERKSE
jgi:hypothetical protein